MTLFGRIIQGQEVRGDAAKRSFHNNGSAEGDCWLRAGMRLKSGGAGVQEAATAPAPMAPRFDVIKSMRKTVYLGNSAPTVEDDLGGVEATGVPEKASDKTKFEEGRLRLGNGQDEEDRKDT